MTEKQNYRVREGVEWVNGARVPASRIVRLTDAEARFDREQGRIESITDAAAPAARSTRRGKSRGRD